MSEENGNGRNVATRSVATPIKLKGRKLRVSPAEKWARAARLKIPPPLRFVFDVESNYKFFKSSLDVKVKKAEELSKKAYEREDRIEITPKIYEDVSTLIYEDARLSLAASVMFSLSFIGQTFQDTLDNAYAKALQHDDPAKVISVHKWAFQFLEYMSNLKGLNRAKAAPPASKPGDVVEGELVDPY